MLFSKNIVAIVVNSLSFGIVHVNNNNLDKAEKVPECFLFTACKMK